MSPLGRKAIPALRPPTRGVTGLCDQCPFGGVFGEQLSLAMCQSQRWCQAEFWMSQLLRLPSGSCWNTEVRAGVVRSCVCLPVPP